MKQIFYFFSAVIFLSSCGGNTIDEATWTIDPSSDLVAFVKDDGYQIFQMEMDGSNVSELETSTAPIWVNAQERLNYTCDGVSDPDDPITLISPDGAIMGNLDDSWRPAWSADKTKVAVSCGRDDNGKVVVVSNFEKSGSSEGWSREGRASLSDRMEIYVHAVDGSQVTKLTKNSSGDWLPRWNPATADFESEIGESILIESNRDGNSEIYLLATETTDQLRITENDVKDRSAAFTRNGRGVAFTSEVGSGKLDEFAIIVAIEGSFFKTNQKGWPVDWHE